MMKRENRNQKPPNRNRSIICMLVLGFIILALLAVPVSAKKLATPTIITPPNNCVLYYTDNPIVFIWKPVDGADKYLFELQEKTATDWTVLVISYSFTGPVKSGKFLYGTYRWRVTANASNPAESSKPTVWQTFTVVPNTIKLATPTAISPPDRTIFYHNSSSFRRFSLHWKPVPGANEYEVSIQYYDASTNTWKYVSPTPESIPASLSASIPGFVNTGYFNDKFPGPYKGRWCVQALDTTGTWLNSTPSAWRTFTFKN